ncbi:hypothetical protein [Huaxiibacter chinensis]|uniref:hypothetical protein n=1 Tax=Huaxiibacter chinensis TaxID=2899785 RepID=UPI003F9ABA1D
MKLIDILVLELPKRGGWPEFALALTQDGDGSICLWEDVDVYQQGGAWAHPSGTGLLKYWCNNQAMKPAEDRSKAIITREQYEAALAASKPEWDGEGLPAVGCEFLFGTHQTKAKCIAVGRDVIFASTGNPDEKDGFYEEFVISIHHSEFRPIHSEAEKKKEEVEKAIADALLKDGDFDYAEALRLSTFVYGAISRNEIPHIRID